MANDKKFVVKNGLQSSNASFVSPDGANTINVIMSNDGSLVFSGDSGTLLSVKDVGTTSHVLIGAGADDGSNQLQVNGNTSITGSLTIGGDFTVTGNVVSVNVETLDVTDNMIYLNSNSAVANPDLGWAANYNDGTYAHTGFFRDATDGVFKAFYGYTPEPDASTEINIAHASFQYAPIAGGGYYVGATQIVNSSGNWVGPNIGLVGYTGSKGDIGYSGSRGYTGSQGPQGVIGYTGSQGIQGIIGYTGSQGVQGVIGYTGSQGATGSQGVIGYTGSQGPTGSQGIQGIQGPIGYTGSVGSQGVIGYTGSASTVIGYTGSQGIQGIQGPIGYTGSQGIQGIQGPIGYTGSQGIQGIQGVIGYTGSQGNLGYTGSASTVIGYTGSQGYTGSRGYTGSSTYAYVSATAPATPYEGMYWFDVEIGKTFIYYNDGTSTQWVDATAGAVNDVVSASFGGTFLGDVTFNQNVSVNGLLMPNSHIVGPINSGANNGKTIGLTTNRYATIYATTFNGTATEALYADVAENYLADSEYESGTVLSFGGIEEVTSAKSHADERLAGVVTTHPAHLMNSALEGEYVAAIALLGRVPVKVIGWVEKGDRLVSSIIEGYAEVDNNAPHSAIIGKAIQNKYDEGKGMIEVLVGRV